MSVEIILEDKDSMTDGILITNATEKKENDKAKSNTNEKET